MDIGAMAQLQDWSEIDWKTVKKRVKNLRQRIYRATSLGQWNKVRSLMKLMLRSYSNLLLSVRRVTQENQGKKTAGMDGQTATTPEERVKLVKEMAEYTTWKARPTKRVFIPKSNGKQRPLGIPTIKDRIAQAIVKNALEPSMEAKFEVNSYGFRPGRSCHDALSQCHIKLQKGRDSWVLDADIKGAFDNINHEFILNSIGDTPGRELIKQWLKAGYVEKEVFNNTDKGTPQGGIISPLLANIALDGLDELLSSYKRVVYRENKGKNWKQKAYQAQYGFIRYADDFVVTAESKEDLELVKPIIEQWLAQRGLELNKDKTQIKHTEEGINFLGFNIRSYNGHCLTTPQRDKVFTKLREIKDWLNSHLTVSNETVIRVLNPIIRGWANYYQHGASAKTFSYFDFRIFKMLYKWALRRHPTKGKRWVNALYFGTVGNDHWRFKARTKDRQGKYQTIFLTKMSDTKITRHVKVKGGSSPDDPSLKQYWEERATKYGKTYFAKGSKLYKVAENQKWKCPICCEHLFNGEPINTHHKLEVHKGGNGEVENLVHLHKSCHLKIHSSQRKSQKA